jgi:acyl-CoA reductase-like NAD-dependent aldehyde dehydrogenase
MGNKRNYEIVDGVEKLEAALLRVKEAQKVFASYTQEQVDKIFSAAAIAANKARIPLAKMAQKWQLRKPAWVLWKIRSSKIITLPSIFTTRIKT